MKIIFIVLVWIGTLVGRQPVHGQILDGQLDLGELSQEHPLYDLTGQWKFYPDVAEPSALNGQTYQLIETPGYWSQGTSLHRFGYGLYHLRITRCTYQHLVLKLGIIHTAYTVWINDQQVAQSGQPGTHPDRFEPDYGTQIIPFTVPAEEFDLYILVSNFAHRKGGILGPSYVGLPEGILHHREANLMVDVFLISIIVTLALYFFIVYFIDRKQHNFLWFGLFCLVTASRLLVINEVPLKVLWPQAPFALITYFRYIGFFLASGLIGLYQDSILNTPFVRRIAHLFFGISVVASLLVLVTPFWVDSYISFGFQGVVIVGITLLYYQFFKLRHSVDVLLIVLMVGFAAIVIAFGHDVLVANGLLLRPYWQSYGFTAYAIAQSIYFGFRYKILNEQLRSLNSSLTEYSLISRKKDEFEQKLLQQLAAMERVGNEENADGVKDMIRQLRQKPNMPIGHQVALDNPERINSDFVFRLKKQYPSLTPTEQELCICIKAKLSNRDIANLRNISPDSVKKAKGRLRRKIDIDNSEDLFSFFDTV